MTIPDPGTPPPPATIGTNPQSASEVNGLVGTHLKGFLSVRATISQDENFMAATDLTASPYHFTSTQESDIKSAISSLNTALEAIDLTFISRIVGMF